MGRSPNLLLSLLQPPTSLAKGWSYIWQKMGWVGFRICRIQAPKPTFKKKKKNQGSGRSVTCPRSPVSQVHPKPPPGPHCGWGRRILGSEADGGATHPPTLLRTSLAASLQQDPNLRFILIPGNRCSLPNPTEAGTTTKSMIQVSLSLAQQARDPTLTPR